MKKLYLLIFISIFISGCSGSDEFYIIDDVNISKLLNESQGFGIILNSTYNNVTNKTNFLVSVNISQIQKRVNGTCPVGFYMSSINEDGSVNCGLDATINDTDTMYSSDEIYINLQNTTFVFNETKFNNSQIWQYVNSTNNIIYNRGNVTINNSLYFGHGAEVLDNSTCLILHSPNKQDRIEICDNASIHLFADGVQIGNFNSNSSNFTNVVSGNGSGLFDVPFNPRNATAPYLFINDSDNSINFNETKLNQTINEASPLQFLWSTIVAGLDTLTANAINTTLNIVTGWGLFISGDNSTQTINISLNQTQLDNEYKIAQSGVTTLNYTTNTTITPNENKSSEIMLEYEIELDCNLLNEEAEIVIYINEQEYSSIYRGCQ